MSVKYKLVLEDGTVWFGESFGAEVERYGEVVFTTSMVGYPESLTDPSYLHQILVLTYPLIGNYGVPENSVDKNGLSSCFESYRIHATGLVVAEYQDKESHWMSSKSLSSWLKEEGVLGLSGIDTRSLTLHLRDRGVMRGWIGPVSTVHTWEGSGVGMISSRVDMPEISISQVSRKGVYYYPDRDLVGGVGEGVGGERGEGGGEGGGRGGGRDGGEAGGRDHILVLDLGIKQHMIRSLLKYSQRSGIGLKVVAWDYDFVQDCLDGKVVGLFLSNGPGDPTHPECQVVISRLATLLEQKTSIPIFAICLGHQLLALASGGTTRKMKFGHRSMNQPCLDLRTGRCYITSQNHGYCVDTIGSGWKPLFINVNDETNEGLIHERLPYFSVQFHPEARGGPPDTEFLFDMFLDKIREPQYQKVVLREVHSISKEVYRRVLLLGSGGLSIGQAGEFDYSGSQAIKALKEEGLEVVLINPNIATVQTDRSPGWADQVFYVPLNVEQVEKVIREVQPDGVLGTFGGQSALSVVVELENRGILKKYGVRVMGTPIKTIETTEDRGLFAEAMKTINQPVAESFAVESLDSAIQAAEKIGYPVMVRAAYTLGGQGSGFAYNQADLEKLVKQCLVVTHQVLVEKSMRGWKEIEYEVVRDRYDNCITVCNMENFDPLGVHTGDSIVVAPSQTLSNDDYFRLRQASIRIIRHLGVVGECNVQYALDPYSNQYCVIEVNARLSRSSALASKATGYPLAYVAAKLALGEDLAELKNRVTETTTACYEPSLDYVVVKIPRWDLQKFPNVDRSIGSAMKSVGEVMAIGRSFEETIQKAARMVTEDRWGLFRDIQEGSDDKGTPSEKRLWSLIRWLYQGSKTARQCIEETNIDRWFIAGLDRIVNHYKRLETIGKIDPETLLASKKLGFNDWMIGKALVCSETEIRRQRLEYGIIPKVRQIDTTAGEFPAKTNYLYLSYQGLSLSSGGSGVSGEIDGGSGGVMVLGCGAYRIGSSVEFDWCAVRAVKTLQQCGHRSIVVNYNPETVSTDYDISDRLYFEELSLERILDIYQFEHSRGVVVSVGGQIPNTLARPLANNGVRVLGTSPENIDRAEDRKKFSDLLDKIGIDQPRWAELTDINSAKSFAREVGYPVLIRPSYVLSGAAMKVVYNDRDVEHYLGGVGGNIVGKDYPVVISKFLKAKEIEMDGVADRGELINYAVSEHVENAGVHSGDATLVLPAQKLYLETVKKIKKATRAIVKELSISGPFNIQFLSRDNDIKVIECNLRASRSFPFVSKTLDMDLIGLATKIMLSVDYDPVVLKVYDMEKVGVKCPVFSFPRLPGADPVLGVDMTSTGEVACFAEDIREAYLLSLTAAGFPIQKLQTSTRVLVSVGHDIDRYSLLDSLKMLEPHYTLYATPGTCDFYKQEEKLPGIEKVEWKDVFNEDYNWGVVINIPKKIEEDEDKVETSLVQGKTKGQSLRRFCVDQSIGLVTNVKLARLLIRSLIK